MKPTTPLFLAALLCAVSLAPPVHAQDDTRLEHANKLEKLLAANKLKEATTFADETFGKDKWCSFKDFGYEPFRLRASLGVLSRQMDRHDMAATCAAMSLLVATSAQQASSAYYELARVVDSASPAQLDAMEDSSLCGVGAYELNEVLEPWREARKTAAEKVADDKQAKALKPVREALRRRLLTKSLEYRPNRVVAKKLQSSSAQKAVDAALAKHAAMKLRTRGPFPSEKEAREQMKKEVASDAAIPGKPIPMKKAERTGKLEAKVVTARVDCDKSSFLALEVGKQHYYVPVLTGMYATGTEDCGGYGEASSIEKPTWPLADEVVFVHGSDQSYSNSECGPVGDDHKPRIYCQLDSGNVPRCIDLGHRRHWASVGDNIGNVGVRYGIRGEVDPKKGVQLKRSYGPKELDAELKKLEGKSVIEFHQGIDAAVKRARSKILKR